MAPSGEHRPEDLGSKTVATVALGLYARAASLRAQATSTGSATAGERPDDASTRMVAEAQAAEKDAERLRVTAEALTIREEAAKAWNRDAPKDSELEAAREAVTAAKKKLSDAAAASGDTSAARTELEAASNHLGILLRKRRDADKAYDAAEKKAQEKLGTLGTSSGDGAETDDHGRGTPGTSNGTGSPSGKPSGTGTSTGSPSTGNGTGKPSTGTGTGNGKPSTGKPSNTPAATPSSTKPSTTEASTATPDSTAALAALLASQQQQQPAAQAAQQQPTAQATPAASTPQQTQQPDKDKDLSQDKTSPWDRIVGADGVLDTGDLAGIIGAPLTLGGGSTPTHATPAATVTPSAPATPTPSATGLSASATANAQPVTSGTSATGLSTPTDVSGRTAEQQRGPFSVGPETKTSGATGTGTSATSPAHSTGARPMGGGMPMMPMGAMGGPGGGGGKDREQAQTTSAAGSAESDLLHGRHTVAEAVPGGTIAQRDHPRHRGESDAA
ncbi:hypothetical protein [Mycolicibacterium farcinogenes]|uniref:Uncharacterized protein n=1 Tax=Mycolicibacterium farcinogenes TaxID=1802 RepID=A0ACD1FI37_MYCFR|nr:hypothetical protein [Mycolicibacterium farcinogenes]QZH66733.1 hypothetical protein K6L26_03300 [Mycolicibacterium farcinogenes]